MIKQEAWRPADGLKLEPSAHSAVTKLDKSAMVVAGPGAGKTELLAQRADFLLRTGSCHYPHRILAIAFKSDAARTLSARARLRSGFDLASRLDSLTFHAFARRIIELFRIVLTGPDALDQGFRVGKKRVGRTQVAFDELVPLALKIIKKEPMVIRSVRMTYGHVFLDEFQDCTDKQYALVFALFADTSIRLTAVGDTKQCIMGWAGALDEVFEKFESDFGAVRIPLFQNYRSKPRIRRVQNAMVKVMEPAAAVDDASIVGNEGTVEVITTATCEDEAVVIAERIAGWIADGVPPDEIAILVPRDVEFFCQPIVEELTRCGVPYRFEQDLQDLSTEPVAELIINFLRVLGATPAPDAYSALMFALSSSDETGDGVTGWHRFIEDARLRVESAPVKRRATVIRQVVGGLVTRLGPAHLAAMSAEYGDTARVDELVTEVCDHLERLFDETGDLSGTLRRFAAEGTVRIMSIHKCKGMEFDAVVMPCTEVETWWGKAKENQSSFFVGVSRAKDHLLVTHAARRTKPDGFPRQWDLARLPQRKFLDYVKIAVTGTGT
jgi:superfamily I DNA/RNA helicase